MLQDRLIHASRLHARRTITFAGTFAGQQHPHNTHTGHICGTTWSRPAVDVRTSEPTTPSRCRGHRSGCRAEHVLAFSTLQPHALRYGCSPLHRFISASTAVNCERRHTIAVTSCSDASPLAWRWRMLASKQPSVRHLQGNAGHECQRRICSQPDRHPASVA